MTIKDHLLIIDDEPDMLDGLKRLLGYEMEDLDVDTCPDPRQALKLTRNRPVDVVLLDVRMPDIDGMELLAALRRDDPWITCIMMTAHGTIELAVEAMRAGAYDFITKPFKTDDLVRTLKKGLERNRLIRENRNLRQRMGDSDFHGMVGQSAPMRRLFEQIQATAHSDYSVLIQGESGTGKELAARAVHNLSRRRNRALVTVNCPAIPEHLLESELFGHRRGAFTGADRDQRGLFEEADAGSLFLDEIGDIPVGIQTKLLRTLQEGEIKPLGTTRPIQVDVRIIAATNQDLEAKIKDRSFREDLYYRLNVVTLRTPSLREIPEDIPLLASHFARMASSELDLLARRFAPEALDLLGRRPWPGNIRELQNTIRRVVMFSRNELIEPAELGFLEGPVDLPAAIPDDERSPGQVESYKAAKERVIDRFTRSYVEDLLKKTGGNVTRSAELSGLGRPSLQKIMRRLGIRADQYRGVH